MTIYLEMVDMDILVEDMNILVVVEEEKYFDIQLVELVELVLME